MAWLKSYVEHDRFENDLKSLSPSLTVLTWAAILLAIYVFGPAFVRMVGELV